MSYSYNHELPARSDPFQHHAAPVAASASPHSDLDNFYDGVPPAHRLSAYTPHSPDGYSYSQPTYGTGAFPSAASFPDSNARGAYSNMNNDHSGYQAPAGGYAYPGADSSARLYDRIDRSGGLGERQGWNEKPLPPSSGTRRKRWLIIGGVLLVLAIVVIATAVGVTMSQKNRSTSGSSEGSSSSSSSNDNVGSDPSKFTKDSNLKQSFWAMAYTPEGSQLPNCGSNLTSVIRDIQIISQLTTRIRLYGADCNQSALVLEAIKQTKVDMTVWLGDYTIPTDDHAAYKRQRDVIVDAIKTYGTDHVGGVTVGNEFMLNYLSANGGTVPDSPIGDQGAAIILQDVSDMRSTLASLNLAKTIQVGNAEAGSYFNTQVLQAVDYGMSNVHPWFANTTIDAAASWTTNFFDETNVQPAALLSNKPTMWIAETGWPTKSSDAGNANNGFADASVANLQKFMDTFVCSSNTAGIGYFFFEFKDEPWKDAQFGGVEGWWGLFDHDRNLKQGLTIPTCS